MHTVWVLIVCKLMEYMNESILRTVCVCIQVVSYEKVLSGEGHCSLIHGLCWAPDSTLLATASADGLVK